MRWGSLLAVLALGACGLRPAAPPALTTDAAALQHIVDPRPGDGQLDWLGGDVASSALLTPTRSVWIFGDTLLGRARRDCPPPLAYCGRAVDDDPQRAMIANSVALLQRDGEQGAGSLVPYWRTVDGEPAPIFEAAGPDEFLWPLAVARVGRPLLVAASVHTRALGLFSLGSVLVRVDDPDAPPSRWRYTRHPLPNAIVATADRPQLSWATALVPLGAHVYLVGEHGVGIGSGTVLARFVIDHVADDAWQPEPEYLAFDGERPVWEAQFDETRLHRLPGLPGISETTFHRGSDDRWRTYRIPPGTFEIRCYTARTLLGPWQDNGVVYRIPAPWSTAQRPDGQPRYAAYAVKAHPELGSLDRPVLTYNVNVTDGRFESAVEEAEERPEFYVPRMVVIP